MYDADIHFMKYCEYETKANLHVIFQVESLHLEFIIFLTLVKIFSYLSRGKA